MNDGLFIAIYLDEDVHILVGDLLTGRGFRAVTARDADQLGKSDSEQLAFAASQRRAILTHNRKDFEELHRRYTAKGQSHPEIVIATRRHPYDLARRLFVLLNTLTADEMQGQLLYI